MDRALELEKLARYWIEDSGPPRHFWYQIGVELEKGRHMHHRSQNRAEEELEKRVLPV